MCIGLIRPTTRSAVALLIFSAMLAFRNGLESMDTLTWSKSSTNVGQMYVGEESVYYEMHWLLNGVRAGFCVQA